MKRKSSEFDYLKKNVELKALKTEKPHTPKGIARRLFDNDRLVTFIIDIPKKPSIPSQVKFAHGGGLPTFVDEHIIDYGMTWYGNVLRCKELNDKN